MRFFLFHGAQLIASAELDCSEEVLTIVAMLSVESIFYRPKVLFHARAAPGALLSRARQN